MYLFQLREIGVNLKSMNKIGNPIKPGSRPKGARIRMQYLGALDQALLLD